MKTAVILFAILLIAVMAQARMSDSQNYTLLYKCEIDADPVDAVMIFLDGDQITGQVFAELQFMDGAFEDNLRVAGEPMNLHDINLFTKRGNFSMKHISEANWEWSDGKSASRHPVTCVDLNN